MRASFLLCLAFCLSVSAVWQITEYTEYYRDSYEYDCTQDLAYVEIEEVETCYSYDYCSSSSYLMYTRTCANTTDLDDYFDDYYMILEYDTQCDSDPVAYHLYSEECLKYYDSYYYSDNYAMWFECYQPLSDVTLYYTYDGTTTCDAGYYSYTNSYGPSVSTSYKLGDCFGYGSTYMQVLCNVSAVPGWQVIKYTATQDGSVDGDCTKDVLYVEYYATDYCQPLGCVEGKDFYENWSCQADEPELADFFTNPVVLYNFNDGSYDCFGDVRSYMVLNPGCAEGDQYYWFFDVEREDGDVTLYYTTSANCTTYYSYNYINGRDFSFWGSEELHYGCVYNDYKYILIADDTATPAYQIVKYYAGPFANGTIINVDMWYTDACIEQIVGQDYDDSGDDFYLTEEWSCVKDEPNPFDFIEDGYLIEYHATDDGACAGNPVEYQVYNTGCTADAGGEYFWTYECTSTYSDTSLDLVRCTDAACTTGCYTYEDIVDAYTVANSYCAYEGKSGYGYYYLELHCSPPSPGYQVVSVYTDLAVKPVRAVVAWNDYCTEYYGGYESGLYYVYNCSFGDEDDELDWTEYFDADPITIDYYYSDTCDEDYYLYTMAFDVGCINTPASSTEFLKGTSVWAYCDPDNGYMTQFLCPYDVVPEWEECIDYENFPYYGACYSESEYPYYYYSSDEDGCFFNYDYDSYYYYNYYTIDCGDIVTNSVYWVESYSTTEIGCTEDPDLMSFSYFTRFCGAGDAGTCTLTDDYYANETCIKQDEIEGYLIGGVIVYTFDSDECDDYNYLEGYTFYYNGCYLDEESGTYTLYECDHAEEDEDYNGLINIGTGCTSCDIETCITTKYEAEDGDCEDGKLYVCSSPAVSVAGLFVAILALLAFAL